MFTWLYLPLGAGVLALIVAAYKANWVNKQNPGSNRLREIGEAIRSGAMAFLVREYKILVLIVVAVTILLVLGESGYGKFIALSFLVGALFSALAGLFGMRTATKANTRTANGARFGITKALMVAFNGGSVMGLSVVGLGILGLTGLLL
ncbi:MAG: sodium-translocating pyrophosphatase, partial [Spirochaetales bacterium]|nr:sodium-translocating pyrophosphatase [Spirochaetales bacterium]